MNDDGRTNWRSLSDPDKWLRSTVVNYYGFYARYENGEETAGYYSFVGSQAKSYGELPQRDPDGQSAFDFDYQLRILEVEVGSELHIALDHAFATLAGAL